MNFPLFSPWFGPFGVNLKGKAINLSLKAIKVTGRPCIGQICNLLWWKWIIMVFSLQILRRVNIIIIYPIAEIQWDPQKQSFQVQKCVSQVVKFDSTEIKFIGKFSVAFIPSHFSILSNFTSSFTNLIVHRWFYSSREDP